VKGVTMADLSKLKSGMAGTASVVVNEDRLATEVGSGTVRVFATPMMIALMEAAAVDCVDGHLPDDHLSLGLHLDVSHTAPTPPGATVTATATLTAIDGRKLTFAVVAEDGRERIGSGTHTRVVVDRPRFMARVAAKSLPQS
jgi:fluoroacetyl-CoA thioesterase